MELTQAQLNSLQALTVSAGKIKTDNLVVGQQVVAKIAAVNAKNGEVTLQINNAQVTVKTLLALTAGETLQLTVAQTNTNKVVFQLPQTLLDAVIKQNTLREAIPRQQPITDTIIQLKSLAATNNQTQHNLPEKLTTFAKQIISHLPSPSQLSTASGVKQAIQQSGVFLENKLASMMNGGTNQLIKNDTKAMFLGLKNLLLTEKTTESTSAKVDAKATPKTDSALTKPLINDTAKTVSHIKNQAQALLLKNTMQSSPETSVATITTKKNIRNLVTQLNLNKKHSEQLNTANLNAEQLKYKKITTIRSIEADIAEIAKLPENRTGSDKQLTDKQIQQILSNLLGQRKSQQNSSAIKMTPNQATGALLSPTNNTTTEKPVTFKTAQQYTSKESLTSKNEFAMTAVKSQHSSEANLPKMNNLVDLIETLIKQVDSAISRTQVHQLNAMHDQESGKLALSLEIPVNDDDNLHLVQLHIEKEPNSDDETETVVTVNLAIDLDTIGAVYARIVLINDNTSVVLWAEEDATFELVQQNVENLHSKLESSGLKSESITCHHGQPPQSRFINLENSNGLLDVRA